MTDSFVPSQNYYRPHSKPEHNTQRALVRSEIGDANGMLAKLRIDEPLDCARHDSDIGGVGAKCRPLRQRCG